MGKKKSGKCTQCIHASCKVAHAMFSNVPTAKTSTPTSNLTEASPLLDEVFNNYTGETMMEMWQHSQIHHRHMICSLVGGPTPAGSADFIGAFPSADPEVTVPGFSRENWYGLNPVCVVAATGHLLGLEKLLSYAGEHGIDINQPIFLDGNGPVHYAVLNDHLTTLAKLIHAGASLTMINKAGNTPFMLALMKNLNAAHILWKNQKSFDINMVNEDGNTAFHLVAMYNRVEFIRLLMAECCAVARNMVHPIQLQNKLGNTALMEAVKSVHPDVFNDLWRYRKWLRLNTQNEDGNSILHLAALAKWDSCLDCIVLEERVNLDLVNHDKDTALHICCRHGYATCVRSLLKHHKDGVSDLPANKHDNTCVVEAFAAGHDGVANIVLEGLSETCREEYCEDFTDALHSADDDAMVPLDADPGDIDKFLMMVYKLFLCDVTRGYMIDAHVLDKWLGVIFRIMKEFKDFMSESLYYMMYVLCNPTWDIRIKCALAKQFVSLQCPDMLVEMIEMLRSKGSSGITPYCLLPMHCLVYHDSGKKWLENNYHHLLAPIDHFQEVLDSGDYPDELTDHIGTLWLEFKQTVKDIQAVQSLRHATELLALEESEKAKKTRKAKKNPKVTEHNCTSDTQQNIDSMNSDVTVVGCKNAETQKVTVNGGTPTMGISSMNTMSVADDETTGWQLDSDQHLLSGKWTKVKKKHSKTSSTAHGATQKLSLKQKTPKVAHKHPGVSKRRPRMSNAAGALPIVTNNQLSGTQHKICNSEKPASECSLANVVAKPPPNTPAARISTTTSQKLRPCAVTKKTGVCPLKRPESKSMLNYNKERSEQTDNQIEKQAKYNSKPNRNSLVSKCSPSKLEAPNASTSTTSSSQNSCVQNTSVDMTNNQPSLHQHELPTPTIPVSAPKCVSAETICPQTAHTIAVNINSRNSMSDVTDGLESADMQDSTAAAAGEPLVVGGGMCEEPPFILRYVGVFNTPITDDTDDADGALRPGQSSTGMPVTEKPQVCDPRVQCSPKPCSDRSDGERYLKQIMEREGIVLSKYSPNLDTCNTGEDVMSASTAAHSQPEVLTGMPCQSSEQILSGQPPQAYELAPQGTNSLRQGSRKAHSTSNADFTGKFTTVAASQEAEKGVHLATDITPSSDMKLEEGDCKQQTVTKEEVWGKVGQKEEHIVESRLDQERVGIGKHTPDENDEFYLQLKLGLDSHLRQMNSTQPEVVIGTDSKLNTSYSGNTNNGEGDDVFSPLSPGSDAWYDKKCDEYLADMPYMNRKWLGQEFMCPNTKSKITEIIERQWKQLGYEQILDHIGGVDYHNINFGKITPTVGYQVPLRPVPYPCAIDKAKGISLLPASLFSDDDSDQEESSTHTTQPSLADEQRGSDVELAFPMEVIEQEAEQHGRHVPTVVTQGRPSHHPSSRNTQEPVADPALWTSLHIYRISNVWRQKIDDFAALPPSERLHCGELNFSLDSAFQLGQSSFRDIIVLGSHDYGIEVAIKRTTYFVSRMISDLVSALPEVVRVHERLLTYISVCNDLNHGYLAMPLCECNLRQHVIVLKSRGQLTLALQRPLVRQILEGLAFLHCHDVIHGRLSPSNVLIDVDGGVRLADFGTTMKHKYGLMKREEVKPHDCWRSSEVPVIGNLRAGMRSDVQVAGMLLFYVMTGGAHPCGPSLEDIQINIKRGWPKRPEISLDVDTILDSMLAILPHVRPSVQEVLSAIFFWSDEQRIAFLISVVRFSKWGASMWEREDLVKRLNSLRLPELRRTTWIASVNRSLIQEVASYHHVIYTPNVTSLLQFIADSAIDIHKMSAASQRDLHPASVFFTSRFPSLASLVYHKLSTSEMAAIQRAMAAAERATNYPPMAAWHNDL